MAPFTQQAASRVEFRSECDAAELAPVNIRDPIVFGQPFIDERVVRRQQIEDIAVFVNDAAEEEFDLTPEGLPEVVIKIRKQRYRRVRRFQAAQLQPLSGKIDHKRIRLRIRQHPSHLTLERRGIAEFLLIRKAHQFIIRTRTPEEERQSGCEFQIAER